MTIKNLVAAVDTRSIQTNTPVSQPIPGREAEMAPTGGGGFTFKVNDWTMLDRFLIIGTEGGTYYATEQTLNADSCKVAKKLILEDGKRVVDRCIEISQAGRARNNDYAILVMAMAITHGSSTVKAYAGQSLSLVCRTGTHLMHFVAFSNAMRGWGKILKTSIQNWYGSKSTEDVAFQAIKYQSRDGWSQRDILRLSHPHAGDDVVRNNVYRYIVKGRGGLAEGDMVPPVIIAFEQAKTADEKTLVNLITDHRLSHEMIPNEMKNRPAVWEALAQHMGTTALMRNLNKMTAIGLIKPFSEFSKQVTAKLNDEAKLIKDRVHPLTVLIAQKQYAMGHGDKGSMVWTPDQSIVNALETSFYSSFKAVRPTGKNMFLAIDVSGSMTSYACSGSNMITCAEGAIVMAMVTARVEKNSAMFGFDHSFRDLKISANDTLAQAMKKAYIGSFGSTNCSLPMHLAEQNKWDIDCFSVYTDNETNQGRNQPSQALADYRKAMNKPYAKLVSVGMAVNNVSIADPKDAGMMDVVGFDSNTPAIIGAFAAGQM